MSGQPSQRRAIRAGDLSVQQLLTLRHVIEHRGYAGAARHMQLSVPTVWQHIQSLQRIYGVTLFEKSGRQVQPTGAAMKLYEAFDEILVGLESTFEEIDHDDRNPGTLTLVTGMRMMMEDLAEPLGVFQRRSGNRLMIRHGNNTRAEELILAGEADLALSLDAGLEQASAAICYEPAYSVDFLAVAPKAHPFAKSKSSGLKELVKHDLVVTAPGTHGRDALQQALYRERLDAKIIVETDNSGFTIACVQAGMGIGILAGRAEGKLCRGLATKSLRRQLGQRQIVFMWRRGRQLNATMSQLIQVVREHHAGC